MKVVIEPSFLLTFAIFISLGDFEYILLIFLSAALHELGHIITLSLFGVKISALVLGLFGGSLILEKRLISYPKEIAVALSGSAMNILALTVSFFFLRGGFSKPLFFFFLSNLTLAFFNLLPIKTLDGGGALIALLSLIKDPDFAEKTVSIISKISLIILTFISVFILRISLFNVSLFAITTLLFLESRVGHIISGYEFCRSTS